MTDTDRLDWLESKRLAGAYVDFDSRGASIRLDRSMTESIREAIDEAMSTDEGATK